MPASERLLPLAAGCAWMPGARARRMSLSVLARPSWPTLLILVLLASLRTAAAWWDTGHMLTAAIAQEMLDRDILAEAESLVSKRRCARWARPTRVAWALG